MIKYPPMVDDAPPADSPYGTMTPPVEAAPQPAQPAGTEDLENHLPGSTGDLESRIQPHPRPMAPEVTPPEESKQTFHDTMRDFGHRQAANRAAVIGLDPNDPDYLKKISALQSQHGAITEEKAHYQQSHPWGSMESAHPGILGKIGHVAGEIGNVAGNALVPHLMPEIPGTQANLASEEAKGQKEVEEGGKGAAQAATTAATEAEVPLRKAETESQEATTKHTEQETTDLKNPQLKSVQEQYSRAVQDAVSRGVDPNQDPKVQQLADSITNIQKQSSTPEQALDKQYNDAIASGDHEKAERILKVMADVAKAKQPPQRAPITEVVLPSGQIEAAKPGMTLPAGTQNISGFAQLNRPTTQERNVGAQARIAVEGIPTVVSEIDRLKDSLGPISGRWNEFMQGKVGMENPDMAGLRADLLMVSSAVALAHARGRLPENLRQEFDHAINAPKQDPENLKAVLNHILPWMQRMENIGQENGGGGGGQTQKFTVGNKVYNIPADKIDEFKKDHPDAR